MEQLNLERAKELNATMVTEEHLLLHAKNVSYAMGAMARHFGADPEHWEAVGLLHDYDYEKYPEEHLRHTELFDQGLDFMWSLGIETLPHLPGKGLS